MKNPELRVTVQKEMQLAKQKWQVNGVPHFVFNGQIQLSGAQSDEYLLRVFEYILQKDAVSSLILKLI